MQTVARKVAYSVIVLYDASMFTEKNCTENDSKITKKNEFNSHISESISKRQADYPFLTEYFLKYFDY